MKVAIVGGGAAGIFAALAVRDRVPNADLTIFDPSDSVARGVAYSFPQKWLRLNVPASKMGGAVEGEALGFADWLRRNHDLPSSEYAPRFLFGDYLSELLSALISSGRCRIDPVEVVSIRPGANGGYRVSSAHSSLDADVVILCTGHLPPNRFLPEHRRIIADVWAPQALDSIAPDDKLLIIGTGATSVDVVLTLQRAQHRGAITMISPHGNFPIIDAAQAPYPDFFGEVQAGRRPLAVLQQLRSEVKRASATGSTWQNVVDSFRHHVGDLWQEWSVRERKQFMRHCAHMWLVHRHRLPPDVAALLQELVASNKLSIRRARYGSLREVPDGFEVQLTERTASTQILVNRIINTTGPSLDFGKATAPLYRQLFAERMGCQDAMGLGLQVDDASQLVSGDRKVSAGLYVLGSATRGHFWEVTAAPDIRLRASRIAKHIAQEATRHERGHTEASVAERVTRIVARQLDVGTTTLTTSTSLVNDLGATSLDMVELFMALEDEFDCEIPELLAETVVTVGDAIQCLDSRAVA